MTTFWVGKPQVSESCPVDDNHSQIPINPHERHGILAHSRCPVEFNTESKLSSSLEFKQNEKQPMDESRWELEPEGQHKMNGKSTAPSSCSTNYAGPGADKDPESRSSSSIAAILAASTPSEPTSG